MDTVTFDTKSFSNLLTACTALGTYEKTLVLAIDKINSASQQAMLHRMSLKLGARYHAVGEETKARFYRNLAEEYGTKASASFKDASTQTKIFESAANAIISKDQSEVRKLFSSGKFRERANEVLEVIVKPTLFSSDLSVSQVSYAWRDINEFVNDLEQTVAEAVNKNRQIKFDMPEFDADSDLAAVDYNDRNWDYSDKEETIREEGKPEKKREPMPKWKEKTIKVGRWATAVICILVAISTCNWGAVTEVIKYWVEFEAATRIICGWL